MPFFGLGLHILLALFCAIHVVRSGQQFYWLFILFAFPMLGSLVYIFTIYLPSARLERGALNAMSAAAKALDPARQVRVARADYQHMPTAQNQMHLAAVLLDMGDAEEAADLYENALKGPLASDPELLLGAARAWTTCQQYARALPHLERLQNTHPAFRPEAVCLLLARCYGGTARPVDAKEMFQGTIDRFGTFEARAEYAIWALGSGNAATAARLQAEMDQITSRWNEMSREHNAPVLRRLKAAQELAKRPL